jgi:hypothetical protein
VPNYSVAARRKIAPTDRLMAEVMTQEPYHSANRVFWTMDNCSAHRGQKAVRRIRSLWPNAILVHTPIHASWLNQIEIYFSIVQRTVLTSKTSYLCPSSSSGYWTSKSTISKPLLRFTGPSLAKTSTLYWPRSPQKPLLPLPPPETPNRTRHRNSEP